MKKGLFILFVCVGITGFSQEVDSLAFLYRIGYKSSLIIDGEEKRGAARSNEELSYKKKKRAYRIRSTKSLDLFYEWDGGFGPNLIKDSLGKPRYLRNRRIDAKTLDDFLAEIIIIDSNTVFPYTLKDVPKTYLKKHALTGESEKTKVDSLLREDFSLLGMSNVTGHFFIQFNYKGIKYELHKDTNNSFWSIRIGEQSIYFFHFAFEAFLRERLPKKFSGFRVLM
jgi:hypothetical protein